MRQWVKGLEFPVTAGRHMGTKEVVISDPQGNSVIGTIVVIVPAGNTVRSPKSTVQTFDLLFARPEFFGNGVDVCQADHRRNSKGQRAILAQHELLGGKGVRAVTIGDELEGYWQFLEFAESTAHGKDT